MNRHVLLSVLALLLLGTAQADIHIFISPDGSNSTGCGGPSDPCNSLQEGFNLACEQQNGSAIPTIVWMDAGEYYLSTYAIAPCEVSLQ